MEQHKQPSVVLSMVSDRYYGILLPWCYSIATTLELPAWELYKKAWATCANDAIAAASSSYRLGYLTLKPVAILCWIMLGKFWKFVLEHGGNSLQTGAIHLKSACFHFYRFQISLNGTQLLGEACLVLMCVGLYYLRKWLQRQMYWAKLVKWYRAKKRRLGQSYTDTMHKIAKVSKILAMALPHSLFLCLGVGLKIAFPGAIRWVTYETPTTVILTMYYPFVSTLVWIHTQRHNWGNSNNISEGDGNTATTTTNNDNNDTATNKRSSKQKQSGKVGTKTKSGISNLKNKFNTTATTMKGGDDKEKSFSTGFVTETIALATTKYWLNYWQLYAIIQAFGSCLSMVPIVGRFLVSHPFFGFLTGECKLFFFVWIFGMEKLLGGGRTTTMTTSNKDAFLAEALPLRLIHKFLTPLVLQLHSLVSETITKQVWQKWVVSKTKTTLDIAVMVRVLSEDKRDWLVHVAEEARVLILPSITLLMPGFVTQFGVAYVQYMVPCAKSAEAASKSAKLVYLEYWILHCGTSGLLHKLGGVLWWVPFSTHMIFLLWSYLILPQAIKSWYGILESELLAFGILPRGKNKNAAACEDGEGATTSVTTIRDTKTLRLFQSLVRRLPSAVVEANEHQETETDDRPPSESATELITESNSGKQRGTTTKAKTTTKSDADATPTPHLITEASDETSMGEMVSTDRE